MAARCVVLVGTGRDVGAVGLGVQRLLQLACIRCSGVQHTAWHRHIRPVFFATRLACAACLWRKVRRLPVGRN
jgi:hypothetical protein